MAYQTPLTVAEVVKNIDEKKYFLPSIQREFVWENEQIEKLFDSIMLDYPINSFLFWSVEKKNTGKFKFYEFLRDYHQQDNTHNPEAHLSGSNDITAILDGQQRMTSFYIGLKGTYAYKLPHKRWDNPQAYPKRKLYLNLLEPDAGEGTRVGFRYNFRFLTDAEVKKGNDSKDKDGKRHYYWFPVSEILNMEEPYAPMDYLIEKGLNHLGDTEQERFANKTLSTLRSAIIDKGTISYYLEDSQELDKVLNIFIRVNEGGTKLSYSDLLLSFATAQWESRNAREALNNAVDEMNEIGRGFNISKDLLLKASLILTDRKDIRFKVDNFNRKNMLIIEERWDEIAASMRLAIELVASFGFNRDNLTTNNPFIPIAYYINKIGNPGNFVEAVKYEKDRTRIKKWFIAAILRRVFSYSSSDSVLQQMCDVIKKNHDCFPIDEIYAKSRRNNRDLTFDEDSIKDLLFLKYGKGDTLMVLSLLYPWADLKNVFDIDHIHPKAMFTSKRLKKAGIPEEDMEFYLSNFNYLGNLQLLESSPNRRKKATPFKEWMDEEYKNKAKRSAYMEKNYIPDVDFSLKNFEEFFTERENLLLEALKKELK